MKSILKTLKKMLTNNWALKVLALLFAVIVWIAVVNVNDPTIIDTITNVPIKIVNEEVITGNNQVYAVESRKYVNVTVSGRRSLVRNLTASSFYAEASLNEMSMTNSVPVVISFRNKSLEGRVTISNQSVSQISVHVEDLVKKKYPVEANIIGTLPGNYELGDVAVTKSEISISAPESVHESIGKLTVDVDIDGETEDFSQKYRINVLDKNGKKISDDDMTLSSKNTKVSVQILKLITVPIVVETEGYPAEGYELLSVTTDPENVTLAGPASIINGIKEIKITGEAADITGITSNVEKNINLIDYLVSGVTIRGEADVKLSVLVEGDISRTFTFGLDDITINNIPSGLDAEILSDNVTISLSGKERYFEGIDVDSLDASIDLKGLGTGRSSVELKIKLPDGLTITKEVKVRVKLSEK